MYMQMLDIYIGKIENIKKIKKSDIFENITIFSNPGCEFSVSC